MKNEMEINFAAAACNEGLARVAVAAFASAADPTLEELADIKTAVSEAVTNAIIHGYGHTDGYTRGKRKTERIHTEDRVRVACRMEQGNLYVEVQDWGSGIEDIDKAMEPLYTTKPELDRSGMGFAFMEAFMDSVQVKSVPGEGTTVMMMRKMEVGDWIGGEDF